MIHGHFGARRAELITIIFGELNKTGFILILVLAILANLHYHFCVCEPHLTNIKPLEILNTLQFGNVQLHHQDIKFVLWL